VIERGHTLLARARVGREAGLHVTAHAAGREGIDPVLARALVDAPLAPSAGWLGARGWTVGSRLAVPLGSRLAVRGGGDVDLTAEQLLFATGALELRDRCGCLVVRATGAHRLGRGGLDVWLTIDFLTPQ
jgi:hypothetical protein